MDGVFIYEFLFRGGETSLPDDDTWHVILARETVGIMGEKVTERAGPFTPEAAEKLGFPLSRILSGLNSSAVALAVAAREELSARTIDHEAALNEVRRIVADYGAEAAAARAEAAAARAEAEAMRATLESITTQEPPAERKKFLGIF